MGKAIIKNSKKGSEKPIEIFVALFVILAVAMILLRMFSGQFASQSQKLEEFASSEEAKATCSNLCTKAQQNKCRFEDQVAYCKTTFRLDLDENNQISNYDKGLYNVCEDSIYCPLDNYCECDIVLDMEGCITIINEHNSKLDPVTETEKMIILDDLFNYGTCNDPTSGKKWTEYFGINTP